MSLDPVSKRNAVARLLGVGLLSLAPFAFAPFALAASDAPAASSAPVGISDGFKFSEQDGESLYHAVCQSCHMSDGQGVHTGAGMYPALAKNPNLAAAPYPVINILRGRKGMPSFKQMLSDQQVAMVTNYVRTHLGNNYKDMVTAAQVQALR